MKLIEESYYERLSDDMDIPVYIKKYNDDGRLIYFEEFQNDESTLTSYMYDNTGRIKEELVVIKRLYGTPGEELKKEYIYNDKGYSIITIQLIQLILFLL